MLCHAVTESNRGRYARQLEQMHRQRHELFVDRMGWSELRRKDGRDIDEYDTEHTVYMLVLNENEDVVASGRYNPSWAPNQFDDESELRRLYTSREPPVGPHVWEGSRLVGGLPHIYGKDFARATLAVLHCAGVEFCLRRGVTHLNSLFEPKATSILTWLGCETEPLGLPTKYQTEDGEKEALAMTWKISADYLKRARAAFGIAGPVLFEASPVMGDELDVQAELAALAEARVS